MTWRVRMTTREEFDRAESQGVSVIGWTYPVEPGSQRKESRDHAAHRAGKPYYFIALPDYKDPRGHMLFSPDVAYGEEQWTMTGEWPKVTIHPSIRCGDRYHGYVTDGIVKDDTDGAKYPVNWRPIHVFVQAVPDHFPMLGMMLRSAVANIHPAVRTFTVCLEAQDIAAWKSSPHYLPTRIIDRPKGFRPHGDFTQSTVQDIASIVKAADGLVGGDDWLFRTDCDVAFVSDSVFDYASRLHADITLAGHQHTEWAKTPVGPFAHMSGACTLIAGRTIKAMAQLDLGRVKRELEQAGLPVVCDVAESYAALLCGLGRMEAIPSMISGCESPSLAFINPGTHSLIHYGALNFDGVHVPKPEVPAALAARGVRW